MPQLDFSVFPSQLFWLTVSFFLMLFIFSKFIIPKTAEMIKLRKEKIDENIEAAAKIKEKVEKALEKYNQALRDATDKAQISLQRTKDELNDTINRRQEDLNARLKLEVEAGEKKVAASRDKALQKLEEVSCALAVDDESRRENMLEELLREFSIAHLRKSPALALSGGERRRLEIARALASQPNYILLDEPLAGIDPIAVGEIRNLVSQLKNRGIGVLITDHNVRETLDITDRAYILHDGTVLMEGTPDEIVANEEVRKVYLGDSFSI